MVSQRLPGDYSFTRGHSLSPSPLRGPLFNPSPCPLRLNYHHQSTPCHSMAQPQPQPLLQDVGGGDEPLYTAVVKPGRPRAPSLTSQCSRSTRTSTVGGLPLFSQRAMSCSPDKFMHRPAAAPGKCACCAQPLTCSHPPKMSCSASNIGHVDALGQYFPFIN